MSEDVFNTDPTPKQLASTQQDVKKPLFGGKPHRLKKGAARTKEIAAMGLAASRNRAALDAAVVSTLSPDEISALVRIYYDKALKGNLPFGEFVMKHLNLLIAKSEVKVSSNEEDKVQKFKDALAIKPDSTDA